MNRVGTMSPTRLGRRVRVSAMGLVVAAAAAVLAGSSAQAGSLPKLASGRPVGSPVSVSLTSETTRTTFGSDLRFTGTVIPAGSKFQVRVFVRMSPSSPYELLGTSTTTVDGQFSFMSAPRGRTDYQARVVVDGTVVTSRPVPVRVSPRVVLSAKRTSGAEAAFTVRVRAAREFTGRSVLLQTQGPTGWETIRTVTLDSDSAAVARLSVPPEASTWRAVLPKSQAGSGYLAGSSQEAILPSQAG